VRAARINTNPARISPYPTCIPISSSGEIPKLKRIVKNTITSGARNTLKKLKRLGTLKAVIHMPPALLKIINQNPVDLSYVIPSKSIIYSSGLI
jgi:GH25 family lysozyme M1 (1,4-beta-N-acetylmuramidase)